MRTEIVEVTDAAGKLLSVPVFQPTGKKLLAKGHQLSQEDLRLLLSEGHQRVTVAVLEDGEIPEDEAAVQIASEAACGSMEIHLSAGGRANLVATENCCVLLDEGLLREMNTTGSVTIATLPNFTYAVAGQRLATVKTVPFAVSLNAFHTALSLAKERGPLIQARPIRSPSIAVLYSDPRTADRGRQLFECIMRTRLERFGTSPSFVLTALEEPGQVARSLEHLLRTKPTVVLMASTTAPAGPEDTVGQAMRTAGCNVESFLAPVEPGNLLLLSYAGETPVVSAPGCFRSPKANVIDLILPPLMARYRLTGEEISTLGHGGLLQ